MENSTKDIFLNKLEEYEIMNRTKKILFSAGFSFNIKEEILIETIFFVKKLLDIIFNIDIIEKIKNFNNISLKKSKLLIDYFSFLFPEEFYIFSKRTNNQKLFNTKVKKENEYYLFFLKKIKKSFSKFEKKINKKKKILSNFSLERTKLLDGESLNFLETCKEKTFFKFSKSKTIYQNILNFCFLEISFIKKDLFLLNFLNYSITKIIKFFKKIFSL